MRIKLVQIIFAALVLLANIGIAQNDSTLTVVQLEQYTEQSKQLVKYLEGTMNFLGNPDELPSEKDIIFNQSYLKMFVDDEVQIEDDLDENREIPLNKDVQAYLKDIDFFFKKVNFTFDIEKVEHLVTDSSILVFKITLNRQLEGITVDNDTVLNNQLRYIEVNLDPLQKDLKIASIYTTKVREKEELRRWWNDMSSDWKNFFGNSVIVYDTLAFNNIIWFSDTSIVTIKKYNEIQVDTVSIVNDSIAELLFANDSTIVSFDTILRMVSDTISVNTNAVYQILKTFRNNNSIDLSDNLTITEISPLSELSELLELNISNTIIEDLNPIRNLKKLLVFNCSGSAVSSLVSLRYIISIVEINISKTTIDNIDVLSNLRELSKVYLSHSNVSNLEPLAGLSNLTHVEASGTNISELSALNKLGMLSDLNISNTQISSLSTLDSATSIQNMNIDSTQISNIEPLSGCVNLSVLQANNTQISTLSPLNNLEKLKVIYCDNSKVNMREANKFMDENSHCLVIYNSQELVNWWENLSGEWRSIFKDSYGISDPVTKEKLHVLINQKRLTVAYNKNISSLKPLMMLHRLEYLDLQNTSIADLTPLSGLNNLEVINLNNTDVQIIEPLSSLHNIKEIHFENTSISELSPLSESNKLEVIYCDKSGVDDLIANNFNSNYPDCLIIYQSEKLKMWWNGLDANWQAELQKPLSLTAIPSREELQQLVDLKTLQIIDNKSLTELNPLHVFVKLNELIVNSTSITDISPILSLTLLKKLDISRNPIPETNEISKLYNLEELALRNTSIDELEPICKLKKLKKLDIAGTKIKSLKYIQGLDKLNELYINNTRIKSIKPLLLLSNLDFLQCYNTSIKPSKIDDYKLQFPKVEVVFY